MAKVGERFRDLEVWAESIKLARDIYEFTGTFPDAERYGLTAQLRRAAVSVPSNIAEGSVRRSRREFRRYLEMAVGSLAEIESQLEITASVVSGTPPGQTVRLRTERIRRMLYGLIRHLDSATNRKR